MWPFRPAASSSQNSRRAFDGKAAEESQLDNAPLLRIDLRKSGERIFQSDQIHFGAGGYAERLVERHHGFSPAALGSVARPGMAHQNVADHLRCNGKEMIPVVPLNPLLIDQLEIRFVNQRCALQRMVRTLPTKLPRGQGA